MIGMIIIIVKIIMIKIIKATTEWVCLSHKHFAAIGGWCRFEAEAIMIL